MKISNESQFIFWLAVGFGIMGGIIGNLFVTSLFEIIKNQDKYQEISGWAYFFLIFSFISIFAFIFWMRWNLNKLTKSQSNTKKSRNKK